MGRIISVIDDDLGLEAHIDIVTLRNGPVVRRIEVKADDGLPRELLDALIPYIGLPSTPVINGVSRPEPEPEPEPEPRPVSAPPAVEPKARKAISTREFSVRRDGGGRIVMPDRALFDEAVKRWGPSPTTLGGVFGVPAHTVSNWKVRYGMEEKAAAARAARAASEEDDVPPAPPGERAHGTIGREMKVS